MNDTHKTMIAGTVLGAGTGLAVGASVTAANVAIGLAKIPLTPLRLCICVVDPFIQIAFAPVKGMLMGGLCTLMGTLGGFGVAASQEEKLKLSTYDFNLRVKDALDALKSDS